MTTSVSLYLAERQSIAIRALEELEELQLFLVGKFNTFGQEVFLEPGESQGVTGGAHLAQREDLVEVDVLRLTQTRHGLRVDEACQLESDVTFVNAIVLRVDSEERLLVEVNNFLLVERGHAFNGVV